MKQNKKKILPEMEMNRCEIAVPKYIFEQIFGGCENFAVTKCEECLKVGEELTLLEYEDNVGYTGREQYIKVKKLLKNVEGIQEGYCIMGW